MNKSLSYVNLSLEWLLVSTFWLGSDTSGTFSLHFAQPSCELERPALEDAHTLVQNWHLLLQIFCKSLLDVRQSISSSRLPQNHLQTAYFHQGKQWFFWSHPRCFGPLGKFQHNIKISIKTVRVSRLSVSCDYDLNYNLSLQVINNISGGVKPKQSNLLIFRNHPINQCWIAQLWKKQQRHQ